MRHMLWAYTHSPLGYLNFDDVNLLRMNPVLVIRLNKNKHCRSPAANAFLARLVQTIRTPSSRQFHDGHTTISAQSQK